MSRDRRMGHAVRDTWPCPEAGREENELTTRQSLSLMHLKLDVVGRELYQMSANMELMRREINRHGCKLGLTDASDIAPLTPKAAHDRY
jgi:hypothetical protein